MQFGREMKIGNNNNVTELNQLEERIASLEQKLQDTSTIDSVRPEKLQTKLNTWVDTVEK